MKRAYALLLALSFFNPAPAAASTTLPRPGLTPTPEPASPPYLELLSTDLRTPKTLSHEATERVIRATLADLRACHRKHRPHLAGRRIAGRLHVTVGARGKVTSVRFESKDAVEDELRRCIADRVSRQRFPDPTAEAPADVSVTLTFTEE
ncbi:MAG: AgmX/PglI C-terminal domain-containing protein [Bdellovibrionaceae bacterium]|nr:AgmX/PglI C-terminal domain-containing protein [Pseudobdellovibrionaceae bacterium]